MPDRFTASIARGQRAFLNAVRLKEQDYGK